MQRPFFFARDARRMRACRACSATRRGHSWARPMPGLVVSRSGGPQDSACSSASLASSQAHSSAAIWSWQSARRRPSSVNSLRRVGSE